MYLAACHRPVRCRPVPRNTHAAAAIAQHEPVPCTGCACSSFNRLCNMVQDGEADVGEVNHALLKRPPLPLPPLPLVPGGAPPHPHHSAAAGTWRFLLLRQALSALPYALQHRGVELGTQPPSKPSPSWSALTQAAALRQQPCLTA
jgi:hypothetical protein